MCRRFEELPTVFVAAVAITYGKHILAVYNPLWKSYTLPMTKLRDQEPWIGAAIRAASEFTRKSFYADEKGDPSKPISADAPIWPLPVGFLRTLERRQSDRDGIEKGYHFQVFGLDLDSKPDLPSGVIARWLTADEFQNDSLPFSGTGRFLIGRLISTATAQGKSFPDNTIRWPYYPNSDAALALIHRIQEDTHEWLVQWNSHWNNYSLPGGHLEGNESFRECIVRELQEELGLQEKVDFTVPANPVVHSEFEAPSRRTGITTSYVHEIFDVELTRKAQKEVSTPPNRWVSEKEIRDCECKDGQPLSHIIKQVLDKTNWK